MPLIRNSGTLVIRCFKSVENCADRLTGAAGPVFVTICWVLIVLGGISFVDVILYHKPVTFVRLAFLPIAILIMVNLYSQYYYATRVPPGNPHAVVEEIKREAPWMVERDGSERESRGLLADRTWAGEKLRKCGRCLGPKPIVGLYNQRYFVLFMGWLSLSCWTFAILGYQDFWLSMAYKPAWVAVTPPILFTLIWVLSVALGCAVPMLLVWHIYLISRGETSIEGHDNDYFTKKAKERGVTYINPYDLGSRRENLEHYFNVGTGRLPYHTLLLPFRYPPSTTGWRFPLHPIALSRKRQEADATDGDRYSNVVIGDEDEGELTDDEGGGGGLWQEDHEEGPWR